jgi:hypothetical protein
MQKNDLLFYDALRYEPNMTQRVMFVKPGGKII